MPDISDLQVVEWDHSITGSSAHSESMGMYSCVDCLDVFLVGVTILI